MKKSNIRKLIIMFIMTVTVITAAGCSVPGMDSKNGSVITADADGYGEGRLGDIMRSCFFDFSVNSAYLCDVYESYLPAEGNVLLVADMNIKNTFTASLPMFDSDFMVTWGDGDDDYSVPATYYAEADGMFGDAAFPSEYMLKINEERSGFMIFEVPKGINDFSILYLEVFEDDSTGDAFFVYFTAEKQ